MHSPENDSRKQACGGVICMDSPQVISSKAPALPIYSETKAFTQQKNTIKPPTVSIDETADEQACPSAVPAETVFLYLPPLSAGGGYVFGRTAFGKACFADGFLRRAAARRIQQEHSTPPMWQSSSIPPSLPVTPAA